MTHVEGRIDPLADIDIIETEPMLADLESLEPAHAGAGETRQGRHEGRQTLRLAMLAQTELAAGRPARAAKKSAKTTARPGACCSC